jgi:hypothetical protein
MNKLKTHIFTFVFNRPDLLQYQIDSLKKFIECDYDISVAYDTRNNEYYDEFKKISEDNLVNFYSYKSEPGQTSSFYHSKIIKSVYDDIIVKYDHDCNVMFLDHDMFLIDDLNVSEEMSIYDILGCLQTREHVRYIWPGMMIFKKSSIENKQFDFYPQTVDGQVLDTGGGTYKLLLDKNIKYLDTEVEYPDDYKGINLKDENVTNGFNYELHFNGKFLHYRNACSWHNSYVISDNEKTNLLKKILSDILDKKDKSFFEIVVARYSEDLSWVDNYKNYSTIYNKGDDKIEGSIDVKNIGREAHSYLYHIVNNYDNLADYTCFLQADPFNPHSPRLYGYLNYVLESNELIPDFFWISERIVEGDFEYQREPYHKIFPNIKYAYNYIFGKQPNIKTFKFGAGAQFCVSKEKIRERSIEFYKNILNIFEHDSGKELDELSIKLLGNSGIHQKFLPSNPEISYHLERFWGLIFNDV